MLLGPALMHIVCADHLIRGGDVKWHATSMVALLSQADDLVQVYLMMQHAQANYDMKFFMKS